MINLQVNKAPWMCLMMIFVFLSCSNQEQNKSSTNLGTLQNNEILLFTASYSNADLSEPGGIGTWAFDNTKGSLRSIGFMELPEASYVINSSKDSMIYTFQEYERGLKPRVMAYKLHQDYRLSMKGAKKIGGGYPCHITLCDDGEKIAISSYQDGLISVFDLDDSGNISSKSKIARHQGSGPVKSRQEGPHAHMALEDAKHACLLVADLGTDQIMIYNYEALNSDSIKAAYSIEMPSASGPRHMVMHPSGDFAFVVNELSGRIATLQYSGDKWILVNDQAYMPASDERQASGSAIRISNDGRYLYFADRTLHQIIVAKIDLEESGVEVIQYQDSMGDFPRDFNISPDGNWIIAGHQRSNDVSVFKIDAVKGTLTLQNHYKDLRPIVCFDWWGA